jgi:hypothetical protein
MSWLDAFFAPSYQTIEIAGVPLPQEAALNFASGFTAVDNPSNGSTDITGTGGSGGGWTFVVSTTASHATPGRAAQLFFRCNSSGGIYTQNLPTSPNAGDIAWFKDEGISGITPAQSGIYTNAITISGGSSAVQNKHTMAVVSNTYAWGAASGDGGGDAFGLMFNGSIWEVIG